MGDAVEVRNRLKSYRHKYEMNQKEFADHLGIGYSTYNTYENQTRQPSLIVALQIANILNLDVKEIFYIDSSSQK